VACYLGKAKNPNASILEMLEPFTHKFCGRAKNKKGREIIDLCITEHEKEHDGQHPDCDPKPDLYRPKVPKDKKDRYECDAYTREKKCLETHKKDCAGDPECESAVESEIEHTEQGIKKYCK